MKILILGLGQYPKGSGVSSARWFAKQGHDVRVTDLKKEKDLGSNVSQLRKFKNVDFVLGRHLKSDIRWADMIVRNPGIRQNSPLLVLARQLGKPIESDISLFMERCPCPVIGITGTRGKSTTSALTAEMLSASKKRTWLGGNIKVSPLTFLAKVKANDVVVLELSSWLVESIGELGISPHIACITNIMRDHLNAYENMEAYVESKAQIFRHQQPDDLLILNADDPYTKRFISEAPSVTRVSSLAKNGDARITNEYFMIGETKVCKVGDIKLKGEHNLKNALTSALIAKSAGATIVGIRKALKSFSGLPDRLELVSKKRGFQYINDTTATTPDATIAALKTVEQSKGTIHLLFGGADKELEFEAIAKEIKKMKRTKKICITVFDGTAFSKVETSFKKQKISFQLVTSMKEAVTYHESHGEKGDTILLSPGCASFGLFKNEFDRGEQFKKRARR
ncbi:MAG: UDP-N-acetylmuramoyl-L-alanine--D-glutamate ligase [bacterium]|nr:UDP-N-acetylmuramoyl-L-alanine--D-glutamate ligase [bacterium]